MTRNSPTDICHHVCSTSGIGARAKVHKPLTHALPVVQELLRLVDSGEVPKQGKEQHGRDDESENGRRFLSFADMSCCH